MNIKVPHVILIFLFSTTVLSAQDPIPEPDFKYQVMFLKEDNTLARLDKTGLSRVEKDKLMPRFVKLVSGYKFYIRANGCCADVSVSGSPTEQFIVKVGDEVDPSDVIQLYKFEQKDETRLLLASNVTLETALNSKHAQLQSISLDFEKVRDNVYLIRHEDKLELGEYVFISSAGSNLSTSAMQSREFEKGYCFSVRN